MTRRVAVVDHTHWDREWYEPLPRLRHRLVDLLDRLLPRLHADPGAAPFLLDGQMAAVDDYLSLRPDRAGLVRDLASSGRLALGPWYVLMDEFLVSGETIVRNLQLGLRRAAAFGGDMGIGYLPDMFGHVAQMPQLLRLAGIDHAVVWRGVPAAVDRTAFWWRSPDGSTVRAEYLPVGYGIGAHLPGGAEALLRRVRALEVELGDLLAAGDPILLMHGGDHLEPPPHLAPLLAAANATQSDFSFASVSLAEHLAAGPVDALPEWSGELRSGARANLLMGVVSNRVDVRAAAARAETALERRAEPLIALWGAPDRWPDAELEAAWLQVIRNAAHDSVCACSADDVVTSVLHRYGQAEAVGVELAADALHRAAAVVDGATVVNPSARTRSGVVEVVVPGDVVPQGTQVIHSTPASTTTVTGTGRDLGRLLAELTTAGWLVDGTATTAEVEVVGGAVVLRLAVDAAAPRRPGRGAIDGPATPVGPRHPAATTGAAAMAEAWAQAGAHRDGPLRIDVVRRPSMHLAARAVDVPGFGWSAWDPAPLDVAPVRLEGLALDNGLVRVTVDGADGTFSIGGLTGLHRLVDDGDEGDTYNYSPPGHDRVVDRPESVVVEGLLAGPVRGVVRVTRTYRWPGCVADGRRTGSEVVEVVSDLEVRAGETAVRVETRLVNRCRDHRLRAWLPLPERATGSEAGCAYASVRRALQAEGGPSERGLATYPARRWVRAGGLVVGVEGVAEYEVVEAGGALALTLLRATGYLSRPAPDYRPNAAGPPLPLEGPQLHGPLVTRYIVAVGGDPWRLVDDAWSPLEVVAGHGEATVLGGRGSHLDIRGAEVASLRRHGGQLELRLFNPTDAATVVTVTGRRGWIVDLRGRPCAAWDGEFALAAWGIATARIEP